jgi:hypothetical protein
MSTRCIAPSEILTIAGASQFGEVAEIIIQTDYMKNVGRVSVFPASTKDFIDFAAGFGNQTLLFAFLKVNNLLR